MEGKFNSVEGVMTYKSKSTMNPKGGISEVHGKMWGIAPSKSYTTQSLTATESAQNSTPGPRQLNS